MLCSLHASGQGGFTFREQVVLQLRHYGRQVDRISCMFLQAKLKSAVQLQDLLDATRMLVPRARFVYLI